MSIASSAPAKTGAGKAGQHSLAGNIRKSPYKAAIGSAAVANGAHRSAQAQAEIDIDALLFPEGIKNGTLLNFEFNII